MILDSKVEPIQSLLVFMNAGLLFSSFMFPAIAMSSPDDDMMGRGLKITTNSFSRLIPAKAAMSCEFNGTAAKLLFVQVRKPDNGGFRTGFEAM